MPPAMRETGRKRRAPRKATALYLERAAMHHLQRYSATAAGLRRVLLRRVDRSARAHGTDPAQGRIWVEELIARFERCGLLDDRRFAQARSRSLLERGTSFRAIALKLRARGVAADEIRLAMETLREGGPDRELEAALALARRRRLGPYRREGEREERRAKDLAALVRAGFPFSLAKKVVCGSAAGF
jgi:regulatory protein